MEHSPRFDNETKGQLVKMANSLPEEMLNSSPLKENISIGRHSLHSFGIGKTHSRRYINERSGIYDGIHLLRPTGNADYTKSVSSILNIFNANSLSENRSNIQQLITTQNRFALLNQGN